MAYSIEIHPKCRDEMERLCKKNPLLENALRKKLDEIIENPHHYKPLRYGLSGERRVHIMKSFVLRFEINEARRAVRLIFFGHHDEAYKR